MYIDKKCARDELSARREAYSPDGKECTKAGLMDNINIIAIREHPEYLDRAADYFSSKWGVNKNIYQDCIANSITTESPLPRWYLMMKNNEIIGSYGMIVNDFISRQDLWPWLCAVYIEESEHGKALGSRLLEHGRKEAARLGFPIVYLCTGHVGFYEKYGWQYIGQGYDVSGDETRMYKAKSISQDEMPCEASRVPDRRRSREKDKGGDWQLTVEN